MQMANELLYQIYIMFLEMAPYIILGLLFVALLNLFITKDWVLKHLGKDDFWSVLKASMLGVPLPLCSCGVIPTAVYMSNNKASKGAVVSFLISTPQTGVDSIIATYGLLGPVFAIYRPFAAFIMGIAGGTISFLVDRKNIRPEEKNYKNIAFKQFTPKVLEANDSWSIKFKKTLRYAFIEFLDDISMQFLAGVIISGLIAYFIPANYFAELGLGSGIVAMIALILIGIPMYICATASIPIALVLMAKGISPGVAFVFLASGPATNAASIAILSKSLGKKVTIFYIGIIACLSIVFGYLLDFIFQYYNLNIDSYIANSIHDQHQHHESGLLPAELMQFFALVFAALLLSSIYRTKVKPFIKKNFKGKAMESSNTIISISGMTCNHCVQSVSKAIETVSGVNNYNVSLADNNATLEGTFNLQEVKSAIEKAGYEVK